MKPRWPKSQGGGGGGRVSGCRPRGRPPGACPTPPRGPWWRLRLSPLAVNRARRAPRGLPTSCEALIEPAIACRHESARRSSRTSVQKLARTRAPRPPVLLVTVTHTVITPPRPRNMYHAHQRPTFNAHNPATPSTPTHTTHEPHAKG